MNNITFGQYVAGNSWIYKLDPRIKILLTALMFVTIFLIPNFIGMAIALGVFVIIFLTTRVSLWKVIKGLKPILFLLIFTVIIQIIYSNKPTYELLYTFDMQIGLFQTLIITGIVLFWLFTKKHIPVKILYLLLAASGVFLILWLTRFDILMWSNFKLNVYKEGLENAGFIAIRIILMIGIAQLLTLSTMPTDINNGIESVLSPLKLLHINVGTFSMLISLTLRFIPTLVMETKKIMNAQASRGVDLNEGKLKDKINQIISLLVPMFVLSFKRAEDLANAMEVRGYVVGAKRTKLDELKLRWRDYVVSLFSLGILATVIYFKVTIHA